ncbi:hypothetical protein MMC24_003486 [Lignoscripta atroalba]|nr:hypothetical protein [Lignoscripta atroalba]
MARSLFGFSRKPPRELKPTDLDPGFGQMLELSKMLAMEARPPPAPKIAKAFKDFFRARQESPTSTALEEIQARHALTTFRHLQETHNADQGLGLSTEDLQVALKALAYIPRGNKYEPHKMLAQLLFEEIHKRREAQPAEKSKATFSKVALLPFIQILSQFGESLAARDLVEKYWHGTLEQEGPFPWMHVLRGFAREHKEEELLRTLEIMQSYGLPFDARTHQTVTVYYADRDDVASTKKWYNHIIARDGSPTPHTNASVLKLCIRQKEFEWGEPIFKSLLAKDPDKHAWNLIFLWAAAKGKGVDEIERMMEIMVRRSKDRGIDIGPDINNINSLVELVNSRNDSYTAERYIALAHKWNIDLDSQTYLLQLDYRIKIGDIDGARAAYSKVRAHEVSGNRDIPLINKLIVSMCNSEHQDYDAIMALVEDLSERKARFEPDTVSALCLLHLQREELHDVIDLLQTHAFHYGLDQRASVRDVFVEFCYDRSNNTSRTWDAYSILREIFAETSIQIRTNLMNEFFARRRSDMACHVFGHMRQQAIKESRPNVDTYIACFEGIAKAVDLESLEMVHNMLKLDSEVEPTTRLYNALMLAYTACEMPYRSLEFWEDIVYSREGPSYNSIRIAFQACEAAPFGERQARDIWGRLKRFEIEVTKEIYAAYIGALAGRATFDEVVQLVDAMEAAIGCPPDALT